MANWLVDWWNRLSQPAKPSNGGVYNTKPSTPSYRPDWNKPTKPKVGGAGQGYLPGPVKAGVAAPAAGGGNTSYARNQATGSGGGGGGGGGGYDYGAAARAAEAKAAAAEAAAKKAGKDQTAKENANTQSIIDALLKSISGFEGGRDAQLKNAQGALDASLAGILSNYQGAVADYQKTGEANEMDEASKSAANLTNRARERMALLDQASSQGAGETDQLRAQLQAFNNSDANQLEIVRSFYDTERNVNSQIAGANSQAETNRRSSWQQNQEKIGTAWAEYYKNYSDTWTNAQRTAAQNSNIDSDYSTAFNPNFGGKNAVDEASRYAGKTYEEQQQTDEWYKNWGGRNNGKNTKLTSVNNAAASSIKAPKAPEGSTLRKDWQSV